MQKLRWLLVACLLFSPAIASAASISIGGQNITYDAVFDGPVSGFMAIELFNATPADPTLFGSWNIDLIIVPLGGATGTLNFTNPGLPSSDYILAGVSSAPAIIDQPDYVFGAAFSIVAPLGVSVPASGTFMFQTAFTTPDQARGDFGVYALPIGGGGFTSWGDNVGNPLEFTNVPFSATQPVLMGVVTVVPEPASALLLAMGGVAGLLIVRRRMRRA